MGKEEIRIHAPACDEDGWHLYKEIVRGDAVTLRRYRFFDAETAQLSYIAFTRALEGRNSPGRRWLRTMTAWLQLSEPVIGK